MGAAPSFCAYAEDTPRSIIRHIVEDQKGIVSSPMRADPSDLSLWGFGGLSMIVLMPEYGGRRSLDERIESGIDREDNSYRAFLSKTNLIGDGRVMFGSSAALYAVGTIRDDPKLQQISAHWFEALADTTIWVTFFKVLAGRNRPDTRHSESEWTGPLGYFRDQGVNSSFPSGHTALVFASAAVITREFDNNPWVGVPAYITAGTAGFSRMYVEKHWLSDVLVAAVLGQSIGTYVENRRHQAPAKTSRIEPIFDEREAGLRWVYRW